eukprot:scaffold5822_cov115-Skeletonema_dohrnii-CCMP3373.AAC.2
MMIIEEINEWRWQKSLVKKTFLDFKLFFLRIGQFSPTLCLGGNLRLFLLSTFLSTDRDYRHRDIAKLLVSSADDVVELEGPSLAMRASFPKRPLFQSKKFAPCCRATCAVYLTTTVPWRERMNVGIEVATDHNYNLI